MAVPCSLYAVSDCVHACIAHHQRRWSLAGMTTIHWPSHATGVGVTYLPTFWKYASHNLSNLHRYSAGGRWLETIQNVSNYPIVVLSDDNATLLLTVTRNCISQSHFQFLFLGKVGPQTPRQTRTYGARERPPVSPVFCVPPPPIFKHLAPSLLLLTSTISCLCLF